MSQKPGVELEVSKQPCDFNEIKGFKRKREQLIPKTGGNWPLRGP